MLTTIYMFDTLKKILFSIKSMIVLVNIHDVVCS